MRCLRRPSVFCSYMHNMHIHICQYSIFHTDLLRVCHIPRNLPPPNQPVQQASVSIIRPSLWPLTRGPCVSIVWIIHAKPYMWFGSPGLSDSSLHSYLLVIMNPSTQETLTRSYCRQPVLIIVHMTVGMSRVHTSQLFCSVIQQGSQFVPRPVHSYLGVHMTQTTGFVRIICASSNLAGDKQIPHVEALPESVALGKARGQT